MAKTMKVLDLKDNGKHFVCIKKMDDDINPYRLYEKYWGYDKNHYSVQRQKQIAKYADVNSVLYLLSRMV